MKAIILAAGQGTRLKKYTKQLPKGMLTVGNKTLIERQIELYRDHGINDIVIVRGFAADTINYPGITYYDNKEFEASNMVSSLMCAEESFNDDAIISYADVLFEERLLKGVANAKADIAVAVDEAWKSYWKMRYGTIRTDLESLRIDEKGNIVEIGRKVSSFEGIDARYIGLLKLSKVALHLAKDLMRAAYKEYTGGKPWQQSGKDVKNAYMTDLLNEFIEQNYEVKAVRFSHGWIEFDTNEDYELVAKLLMNGELDEWIKL